MLHKRVFAIDLERCPNCGCDIKIIAAILDAAVIEHLLTHLRLQREHRHAAVLYDGEACLGGRIIQAPVQARR